MTGLVVERRAEGVLLADPSGLFTDRPFPGRGGAVTRTAGLLMAKLADLFESSWAALVHMDVPTHADQHLDLVRQIDAGLPRDGVIGELAWTDTTTQAPPPTGEPRRAPLVERHRMEEMVADLFEEFGPASFTNTWQQDPHGLLDAAVGLLTDLRLVRPVPGGVLVMPAAMRYRNIQGALPERPDTGLLPFGPLDQESSNTPTDAAQETEGTIR